MFSIGINHFRLVGLVEFFRVLMIGKKPFSVGLVAQFFQPASNWVETVEKETTENGWKSILLENVNRFKPNPVSVETVDPNRTRP